MNNIIVINCFYINLFSDINRFFDIEKHVIDYYLSSICFDIKKVPLLIVSSTSIFDITTLFDILQLFDINKF